jgi:hypothetical protein
MNNEIKKILSIILLFALMFSTIGFTINFHICGESGKKFANLFQASKCSCEDKLISEESDEDLPSCCQVHNFATNQRLSSKVCCYDYQTTVIIKDSFIANPLVKLFYENTLLNYIIVNINYKLFDYNYFKSKLNSLKTIFSISESIIFKFIEFFGTYDNEDNIICL